MLKVAFEIEILKNLNNIDMNDSEYEILDNTLARLEQIAYKKPYSKVKLKEVIQEELNTNNYKTINETVNNLNTQLMYFLNSRNKTLKIITKYRNRFYTSRFKKTTRKLFLK